MHRLLRVGGAAWATPGLMAAASVAHAQPQEQAGKTREAEVVASHSDYGGDLAKREYLTGDWVDARNQIADKGLTFDFLWTQIAQGVVSGGRRKDWDYGGNLDALLEADMERMGLRIPGTISVRAETRYGETVNDDSGAFTPVNTRGYFPIAVGGINEGIPLAITEFTYSVSLSDTLDLTLGKMITVDGDPTEFAGGRGRTQFLNSNFVYNAAGSQTSPYCAAGAAIDWSPAHWIPVSSAVFATTDSSTTTGFDHLNEGWTWWTQVATQYNLDGFPGGMNVGAQYAFGEDFADLGDTLILTPGGISVGTVRNSWAVYWGCWQYVYLPEAPPEEIDAGDERAD